MQKSLTLPTSAIVISLAAPLPHLRDVASHLSPPTDLPLIIEGPPAPVVPAVPLEPSPRIVTIDPAFPAPLRQWQRRIHAKVIHRRIVPVRRQPRVSKPAHGKLFAAIRHVSAAENAQLQHLSRRQLRQETRIEATAFRFGEFVTVVALHAIVYDDHLTHPGIPRPRARCRPPCLETRKRAPAASHPSKSVPRRC